MKPFRIKFITPEGKIRRDRIWAEDNRAANLALRARGNYPILITEEATQPSGSKRYRTQLKAKDVISILDQMEMQLDAEITIDEALRNLAQEFPKGNIHFVVSRILERVTIDGRIAEAFAQFPKIFPQHVIHMIDVGHQTGNLTNAFNKIARHLNTADEIKGIVRKAISYPIISFFVITGVAIFLLGFVLPTFAKVFNELGVPLPGLTRFYLSASTFIRAHLFEAVALFLSTPFICWWLLSFRFVKELVDRILVRIPIVKHLIQYIVISRLAGNLGTLYEAEIPMQEAVKLCANITGNSVYDRELQIAHDRIGAGLGLGEALASSRWFPAMAAQSLRIGERSGKLGKALDKLYDYYSRRSSETVSLVLQFIEPALTVGLGLFVGSVAVSLMYPLATLVTKIK